MNFNLFVAVEKQPEVQMIASEEGDPRSINRMKSTKTIHPSLNTRPMSYLRCSVCDIELDGEKLFVMVLKTPRGKQTWARCSGCRSFFAIERYDPEHEVEHTRTQPWGMIEKGKALNDYKSLMFESILHVLRNYAKPGSRLLDIGCSYGGFLKQAQKEGYQVHGIDIVPEAVEYVRSQGIPCDYAKSAGDLDIADGSQEIISVLDCNYYWPDQRRELRLLNSRLCPNGLLVMRVVDTSWVVQIGVWLRKWFPAVGQRLCERAVYDHRVSIPVRSLLRLLQEEEFEIVFTSIRDAMPSRYNSLKVKAAYAVGRLIQWTTGGYMAPGCVILARKRTA